MLRKNSRPFTRRFLIGGAKILFVAEAISFAVSYGVWYRLNTNREFRKYMKDNCPTILEGYYKVGEILGDNNQRKFDIEIWKNLDKTKD